MFNKNLILTLALSTSISGLAAAEAGDQGTPQGQIHRAPENAPDAPIAARAAVAPGHPNNPVARELFAPINGNDPQVAQDEEAEQIAVLEFVIQQLDIQIQNLLENGVNNQVIAPLQEQRAQRQAELAGLLVLQE